MQNKISYTSTMNILDHENIGSNEKAKVVNSDIFILDTSKKTHHAFFIGKCGGEIRVELKITFKQNASGSISIKESVKLFEGTSTNTSDLDGVAAKAITVAKNQTKIVTFRVRNTDEGDDYADIKLKVTNTIVSDTNCTASIKAKAQALGSSFTGAATSNINAPTTVKKGKRVTFKKCDIYCSPKTGTHEIHGAIKHKYNTVGGPNNALSLPVTDETTTPDKKGRYNHFIGNGSIYWHPTTGPKLVRGGIRHTWAKDGWEKGKYGYPTSDEIKIHTNKNEWFSDFQNDVIFWVNKKAEKPKTASLSGSKVRSLFDKIFRDKAKGENDLNIDSIKISKVGDTGYDFTRSKNRKVTFKIEGDYESGVFFIPNPSYTITLRIAFESNKNPDGKVKCKLSARLDHWHIHTSGAGSGKLLKGLKESILNGFSKPLELGEVPANVGFLSFKVKKSGGIKLYFTTTGLGPIGAAAAQLELNKL